MLWCFVEIVLIIVVTLRFYNRQILDFWRLVQYMFFLKTKTEINTACVEDLVGSDIISSRDVIRLTYPPIPLLSPSSYWSPNPIVREWFMDSFTSDNNKLHLVLGIFVSSKADTDACKETSRVDK
jgi:hypothetical protein